MKVKCDFVTNSSSTSNVIQIPKKDLKFIKIQKIDFVSLLDCPNEKALKSLFELEKTTKIKVQKQINNLFHKLEQDGFLLLFEENTSWLVYKTIEKIFKDPMVTTEIQHSEDGQGFLLIIVRKSWYEK